MSDTLIYLRGPFNQMLVNAAFYNIKVNKASPAVVELLGELLIGEKLYCIYLKYFNVMCENNPL